jgi:hypothetical protein
MLPRSDWGVSLCSQLGTQVKRSRIRFTTRFRQPNECRPRTRHVRGRRQAVRRSARRRLCCLGSLARITKIAPQPDHFRLRALGSPTRKVLKRSAPLASREQSVTPQAGNFALGQQCPSRAQNFDSVAKPRSQRCVCNLLQVDAIAAPSGPSLTFASGSGRLSCEC